MGIYINPGTESFKLIRNGTYVDKSGLIGLVNESIGTKKFLNFVSRPRRFGKSFAAQMLCAYYDKDCDSAGLFCDLEIARHPSYKEHLNKYDVLLLDMTAAIFSARGKDFAKSVANNVAEDLSIEYPEVAKRDELMPMLADAVRLSGHKFVAIIDEWDAPIREAENDEEVKKYLHFLRTLFKNAGATDQVFAAAYMTGILPIKRDGSQSAISDFQEFTMINPWKYDRYMGFTEDEVKKLCEENGADFAMMKKWYDGYSFPNLKSVYNPNSVMEAIRWGEFRSYWTQTSAATTLMDYVSMNFDGLGELVAELVGGGSAKVDVLGFGNDMHDVKDADVAYLPKKGTGLPAFVIELKWNKSAEGAIAQIKEKGYPKAFTEYGSEVLLVGINYDKDAPAGQRKHECVIERA